MAADIGVVGLGVMGANLALNLADHGFAVAVYNRTTATTEEFLAGEAGRLGIEGHHTIAELVAALAPPRKVLLMVKAGAAVDAVIAALAPLLDRGDIIVDGGNSQFTDTIRRTTELSQRGLRFVGAGISGGEEGARHGPSIMPGGDPQAWPHLKEMLQAVAAKVSDGTPCCDWVGADGAGHYVKMVHNGIEYGDMQVIAEAYHLMHAGLGLGHDRMAEVFAEWDRGPLDSFLIEITARILRRRQDGEPLLEQVLDAAGQKGTGKWTALSSLELGQPVTLVAEAVYARILSALKEQRVVASTVLSGPAPAAAGEDAAAVLEDLGQALYASKIVSYAQGFMLLRAAADEYGWDLDYGGIAYLWREGCIIRSVLLEHIKQAFDRNPDLPNLLLDPHFRSEVDRAQEGWRRTVTRAVEWGMPVPAYSTALAFYDGYRAERLPANLIQAQRDLFGAHTYERIDRPRGEFFHSDWDDG